MLASVSFVVIVQHMADSVKVVHCSVPAGPFASGGLQFSLCYPFSVPSSISQGPLIRVHEGWPERIQPRNMENRGTEGWISVWTAFVGIFSELPESHLCDSDQSLLWTFEKQIISEDWRAQKSAHIPLWVVNGCVLCTRLSEQLNHGYFPTFPAFCCLLIQRGKPKFCIRTLRCAELILTFFL